MPQPSPDTARTRRNSFRRMDGTDLDQWEALARTANDWNASEQDNGVSDAAIQDAAKAFYVAELAIRQLALALDDLADTVYCDLPYTNPRANVHPTSWYARINDMKAVADELEGYSEPVEDGDDAFSWLADVHDLIERLAELNRTSLTLARIDARKAVESVGQRLGQAIPGAA